MNIVFGGSQYLGNSLCKHFFEKGKLFAGTYFSNSKKGLIYFDVKNSNLINFGPDLKKVKYGFICSAISNIDYCKENKEKSYAVNVFGNKRLIQQLWDNQIMPIFFSSDAVFDGEKQGSYSEWDKPEPYNIYGTHKKLIEDFLINSNKDYLIVRLSKVFGTEKQDQTLLTSWVEQLKKGKEIICSRDQTFSPIFIKDLVNCLDILLEKRLTGVYNLGPPESFNRYDLATILKNQLNITTGKIKPVLTKDLNFLDLRPLDTTMDPRKIIKDTSYVFRKMKDCIKDLENLL
tara:strand:+ start:372 stop:1238 length:867 start_codon:yes stop_codon:yes gene_type:complete